MSKRGLKLQQRLTAEQRRSRINRLQERSARAKQIISLGTDVAFEAIDKRAWQASRYGKRMAFTAPGALRDAVVRECELHGGRAVELPTARLALSQHCLCGVKAKKPLSQRAHVCVACGLGPLDRDLFSAYLARLAAESGLVDLADAPFNDHEHRQEAARLCASPCSARVNAGNVSGLRAELAVQTPAQEPASTTGGKRAGRRTTRKQRLLLAATVP